MEGSPSSEQISSSADSCLRQAKEDLLEKLADASQYRTLLKTTGEYAQSFLDELQKLIEDAGLKESELGAVVVAMQRLSTRTSLMPDVYQLHDVEPLSDRPLSEGAFAEVFQGRYKQHMVCLKLIKVAKTSDPREITKSVARETILWNQLSHKNVQPFLGFCQIDRRPCLVSPWMQNGNVVEYLQQSPEANRLLLVLGVTRGLKYLHLNKIVHGDLKGANVLVDTDGNARLADFGLSSVSDPNIPSWSTQSASGSQGGSYRWMAPEVLISEGPNTNESDVYSWGCTSYEILTGQIPFVEYKKETTVIVQKSKGKTPSRPVDDHRAWQWGLSPELWKCMDTSWDRNVASRPSVSGLLEMLVNCTHGVPQ